jgi:dTMP kinase
MTGTRDENNGGSVLTSLRELARLEAERVREVREASLRRAEAEEAQRREEERAAREAALLHTQRLEEAARKRAEYDEAQRRDAIARAAREEAERAHRHAIELAAAQRPPEVAPAPRRAIAPVILASLAVNGALAALLFMRAAHHDREAATAIALRDQSLLAEQQKLAAASDAAQRLERDLASSRDEASLARAAAARAQSQLDALRITCGRRAPPPPGPQPSRAKDTGFGTGACNPRDPLCSTIGKPAP